MLLLIAAWLVAAASASPSPTPAPSPASAVSVGGDFTLYAVGSSAVNNTGALDTPDGADLSNRSDVANLLLNFSAIAGNLSAHATVGEYGLPTLGMALNPTAQAGANTDLYSVLPTASLAYTIGKHWSFGIGKYAALLGQESPFTFQNVNVQRGIAWAMEPTISRGVQTSYTNGAWSATLQENDAYYSGHNRAIEGLLAWSPSSSTTVQFAAIVPGANAEPNRTVGVGNKTEYNVMYTRQIGRLQLLPYLLFVNSPASARLGYARAETAAAAALLGTWTFSPTWLLAFRFEAAGNGSAASDANANADLVGFGPGSAVQTLTLTPTYRTASGGVFRLEYSLVTLSSFTDGLGFGPAGTGSTQSRYGFEFGVMR